MFRKIIKGLKDVWCGTLEFDTEPKKGSFNPVTSDGIYDAINGASGAKELVYFDVDPSDPPSGIYAAITEALSNNKEPVIKNDGTVYFYSSTSTDKYIFVGGYDTDVVNYTTVTVSDDDSIVKETVDTIEGMVFPLYYHSNGEGFTVADKTGHALTKTEIADAYRAGQIFMFSSYPASNTQAHWGYCCDINIESDNTGYAEFFILAAFGGDSYEWEKYRINLSSGTEFVTLWGPNTSYSTGYSGSYADGATTVSVSTTQNFNSTQKAKARDNIGAASASDVTALQSQVSSLSDVSAYSVKGEATVAQLNAGPSGIQAGWAYQLTDSGTLTDGSLAVVAGDTVAWDGTKWFPLVKSDYYATKTYAQNVAHSIASEFDPTRTSENMYEAGEIVTYTDGKSYKFKVDHYGAWNAADVERYDAGESLKLFVITDNPEYLYAVTDKHGVFLFGIKKDGSVEWQKGVPEHLRKIISEKVDKVAGKSLVDSTFAEGVSVTSNPEYIKVLMDSLGRVLEGVDAEGYHVFKKGIRWSKENLTDLQKCLKEYGISSGTGDWSDSATLNVARPKVAVINFSGIAAMPTSKTDDLKAVVEFWDMNGNYFKKPCIINAQGSGSLRLPKKNVSIDLLNADGSDFVLKIGRWVSQSSFHIKAYYEDITRGLAAVCYDIWDEMLAVDGVKSNAVWKKALIGADVGTAHNLMYSEDNFTKRMDNEPVNHPLGFPCVMFLNGEFYGVFAWQLKKHRDNYAMKKNNNSHIHLDGNGLGYAGFFGGTIDWTGFEVRNPKGLKNMDGTSYDGDNPQEIQAGAVKDAIVRLSQFIEDITEVYNEHGADSAQFKTKFEEYFDPQNVCDYIVFSDFISNVDGVDRNWQYITYDGLKWWICPYDLDLCFGYMGNDKLKRPDYNAHFSGTLATMRSVLGVFFKRTEYVNLCIARWAQLRQRGVFSLENVMNKVMAWVDAVGFGRYEDEYTKWNQCRVNGDPIISEKWELVLDENDRPIYGNFSTYNPETSYAVNDECYFGYNGYMGYLKFKCVSPSTGVEPITAFGIKDSIVRIENWVTVYLGYMDALYNYNNQ